MKALGKTTADVIHWWWTRYIHNPNGEKALLERSGFQGMVSALFIFTLTSYGQGVFEQADWKMQVATAVAAIVGGGSAAVAGTKSKKV
jgi:hypothetical protein